MTTKKMNLATLVNSKKMLQTLKTKKKMILEILTTSNLPRKKLLLQVSI